MIQVDLVAILDRSQRVQHDLVYAKVAADVFVLPEGKMM